MRPYIGVTGFMTPQEVRAAQRKFDMLYMDGSHALQIGVLSSSKKLGGLDNKYPNRYPNIDAISGIFQDHPDAFNVLHYNTDDPETLAYQLKVYAKEIAGPLLHGFQLNVKWPKADTLLDFRCATSDAYELMLQISRGAMEEFGHQVTPIAEKIASYGENIDAVLIDQSGGQGHVIKDLQFTLELIDAVKKRAPAVHIGIAGGLRAGTLHCIRPILARHPEVSIDAESGLRALEYDDLDLPEVIDYFKAFRRERAQSVRLRPALRAG